MGLDGTTGISGISLIGFISGGRDSFQHYLLSSTSTNKRASVPGGHNISPHRRKAPNVGRHDKEFTKMEDLKTEIQNAINLLNLQKGDIQLLDDTSSKQIINDCYSHFVKSENQRWWWTDFKFPSYFISDLEAPFMYLGKLIPLSKEKVWFIIENDMNPDFLVYDSNPSVIQHIIPECSYFEYYIVAKNKEWLLCENHHNTLFAIGDKINKTTLNWQSS